MARCTFCVTVIQPEEESVRIAGSGLHELRAHTRCIPTTRDFRERVSLDDRASANSTPLKERELREGGQS